MEEKKYISFSPFIGVVKKKGHVLSQTDRGCLCWVDGEQGVNLNLFLVIFPPGALENILNKQRERERARESVRERERERERERGGVYGEKESDRSYMLCQHINNPHPMCVCLLP